MAIAMTSVVLQEGVKNLTMQFTGVADGPGDETNVLVVDPSAMTPVPKTVKINAVDYDVSGGLVRFAWDDPGDPVPALELAGSSVKDYEKIGGMPNATSGPNSGGLTLSTVGFDAGSSYTITLTMQKKYPPYAGVGGGTGPY